NYELSLTGYDGAALAASARGKADFSMQDGALTRVILPAVSDPLYVHRLPAELRVSDGKVEVEQGQLISRTATYEISGAASFDSTLAFIFAHDGVATFDIGCSSREPRVSAYMKPETRAELKH